MENCSELVLFLHYSSNNVDISKYQPVTLWYKFTIQILVYFVWFCQQLVLQVNPHSKFCFNVFSWCLSFGFCSATVFYVLCFFHHSVLISINSCGLSVHFSVFCHWCLETKCQDLFHQLFTGFKTSKVNFFLWNLISAFCHWPYLTLIKLYKMDFSIHHLRQNLIHTLHPVHFWIDYSRQKVLADYYNGMIKVLADYYIGMIKVPHDEKRQSWFTQIIPLFDIIHSLIVGCMFLSHVVFTILYEIFVSNQHKNFSSRWNKYVWVFFLCNHIIYQL